jgi:hypothetical protein
MAGGGDCLDHLRRGLTAERCVGRLLEQIGVSLHPLRSGQEEIGRALQPEGLLQEMGAFQKQPLLMQPA